MFRPVKISGQENEIHFISDLHFGHNRDFIFGPRGFKTVEEHDETLIHRWNQYCTNRSTVFNLGDFCFNDPDGQRFKNICRRLNFDTMYLLIGNHISGHLQVYKETLLKSFPDSVVDGQLQYEVFPLEYFVDDNPNKRVVFLPAYADASINGWRFALCHYAIISHNKQGHGSYFLGGHSHGNCEFTNKNTGKGYRLDVGVESFGRPINLKELKDFFSKREIVSYDHHNENQRP